MKTLYFECKMGAAGDMLSAALIELFDDRSAILTKLNEIGLPDVHFELEPVEKIGVLGSGLRVRVHGEEETVEDLPPHLHHTHGHDAHHKHDHHHHDHEHHHHHEDEAGHHHAHEHAHGHEHHHDPNGHDHPTHEHHHEHRSIRDVEAIIQAANVSDTVKSNALAVYQLIADAESKAHGVPVNEVHFHEVGAIDAIADILAAAFLIEALNVDRIIASPIHVGSGFVRCAHGILPVPAPAAADILRGVPSYGGLIQGELCTPTGAALIKHFATEFGPQPLMTVEKIGYGMGKKDFPAANCVRAFLGSEPN